ncbi:MAG: arylsulfatase [Pirellulaceae bacterium]|jgi:arylsulfatase A-like enzyme|nr:arylsulfatase [Pirellulaceae bacterium]
MITRSSPSLIAFLLVSAFAHTEKVFVFADQPNVLIVMTDDQGYPEISAHGNPILKTPNLDSLHKKSFRLTDFHVAPMCAPTRGQLLTGLDAARNGCINVSSGRALLRPEVPTIANIFGDAGYATGIFGKWHLGSNYPFRPEDRGFKRTVWFPSSHIGSVPDTWGNDYFDDTYVSNGKPKAFKGYCTDVFFDQAMSFMKDATESGKPFLAFVATNTPHGPLHPKEEDRVALEAALASPKFETMNPVLKKQLANYLGMIRNIDTNMGRLSRFLDAEALTRNTIVIFLTDNGSTHGPRYFNAGMRGGKTELWDGGHRVPCFISWPAGNLVATQDIDGLTQVQDILPTLVDLCKVKSTTQFSGTSLAPILRGQSKVPKDRMLIINYSRMPNFVNYPTPFAQSIMRRDHAAVLWKRWRLLEDRELYNLETDPLQQNNVIDEHPEVVKKMRATLYHWWQKVGPDANQPQRVVIGSEHENPSRLTACEWLDVFIDQQGQIRRGVQKSGYWLLDVAQDGQYEFELRRWPRDADLPLTEAMPDGTGKALSINSASFYLSNYHHLKIAEKKSYGFEGRSKKVKRGDKSIVFSAKLKKGPIALHTWFRGKDTILSAYYVYVTRK